MRSAVARGIGMVKSAPGTTCVIHRQVAVGDSLSGGASAVTEALRKHCTICSGSRRLWSVTPLYGSTSPFILRAAHVIEDCFPPVWTGAPLITRILRATLPTSSERARLLRINFRLSNLEGRTEFFTSSYTPLLPVGRRMIDPHKILSLPQMPSVVRPRSHQKARSRVAERYPF